MRPQADLDAILNTAGRTTVVAELAKAVEAFAMTAEQLREVVLAGFRHSFYPGPWAEREAYVARAAAFYDRLAREHGVA